jgi:hypothetical protein
LNGKLIILIQRDVMWFDDASVFLSSLGRARANAGAPHPTACGRLIDKG